MVSVSGSTPSFPMAESLTGSPMAVRPAIYIRRYANGQVRIASPDLSGSGHRDEGYIDKVQTSPLGRWGQGRPAEQKANGQRLKNGCNEQQRRSKKKNGGFPPKNRATVSVYTDQTARHVIADIHDRTIG